MPNLSPSFHAFLTRWRIRGVSNLLFFRVGHLARVPAIVGLSAVTGCSFLPSGGPSSGQIKSSASIITNKEESGPEHYQVIRINEPVLAALKNGEQASSESGLSTLAAPAGTGAGLESLFRPKDISGLPKASAPVIHPGDTLTVSIYDVAGGLFGPSAASSGGSSSSEGSQTFPSEVVDQGGQITVPFAGRVQATGRTTYEIEQDIVAKLRRKAIDPQALVTNTAQNGGTVVTVTGDVKNPMLYPISPAGARLLEAITAAGGSLAGAHQTNVSVIRGTIARTNTLAEIEGDVRKNIPLEPGDTVIIRTGAWTYMAFGESGAALSGKPSIFSFNGSNDSMADAMATIGGILDNRGMLSVYLYRTEQTKFVEQMGIKPLDPASPTTPVIYLLDLHSPDGFFFARRFAIRDKDMLYFPNADSVGLLKFAAVITAVTTPLNSKVTSGAAGF